MSDDPLSREVVCIPCRWKGTLGELYPAVGNNFCCPKCGSAETYPINSPPIDLSR